MRNAHGFILEYDLRKQRDYSLITEELKKFDSVRILESLWCFNRVTTCENLRNHFSQFIGKDDGIIVSEVTNWASINVLATPKKVS